MKETQALIAKARRYLRSAELLLRDGDCESSVSRGYYAMFYRAEAVLLMKGLAFSSHRGVIAAFGEHFIKTGVFPRDMGRDLNRAFEKRQLGDYESTPVVFDEDAHDLLAHATEFCGVIERWISEAQPDTK